MKWLKKSDEGGKICMQMGVKDGEAKAGIWQERQRDQWWEWSVGLGESRVSA